MFLIGLYFSLLTGITNTMESKSSTSWSRRRDNVKKKKPRKRSKPSAANWRLCWVRVTVLEHELPTLFN